ncbi:MAG: CDP-alcohol phosphatidyltransferase family protein [Cereibacter sphaeroides]|uniref:CDP-alcohol phosphatidyltransferase family protein n=1 Tax=Cereibacter sphaeroides TaxID=1063 RepID=A0A2W5SA64_CERSP|nr:MAG: CDP-alcohol phosphatidyltransferase family protein [Cereibacter sphaeroides]
MLDSYMRPLIDPALAGAGRALVRRGVSANALTLAGLALGVLSAAMIVGGAMGWALIFLVASRLCDGLDGAVARVSGKTDFGGYLDITCDFLFYGIFPLAFVLSDPASNGLAGAFLLTSFYVNGASFLGFAILAAKQGMETRAQGEKSLYFSAGLLEGTETILFFIALCLWPGAFAPLAWIFGALCFATACARVLLAWRVFGRG